MFEYYFAGVEALVIFFKAKMKKEKKTYRRISLEDDIRKKKKEEKPMRIMLLNSAPVAYPSCVIHASATCLDTWQSMKLKKKIEGMGNEKTRKEENRAGASVAASRSQLW